jgi:hypothetical protein
LGWFTGLMLAARLAEQTSAFSPAAALTLSRDYD